MKVHLTWSQCEQAAMAGSKRRLLALCDGRPSYHGYSQDDPWGSDIEAAGAELAVAFATGRHWVPWERSPAMVKADVLPCLQVRHRPTEGGHLILHEKDSDDDLFIYVTGRMPHYMIHGWIRGAEGKEDSWGDPFNTKRPAFWVPIDRLRDFALLGQEIFERIQDTGVR